MVPLVTRQAHGSGIFVLQREGDSMTGLIAPKGALGHKRVRLFWSWYRTPLN